MEEMVIVNGGFIVFSIVKTHDEAQIKYIKTTDKSEHRYDYKRFKLELESFFEDPNISNKEFRPVDSDGFKPKIFEYICDDTIFYQNGKRRRALFTSYELEYAMSLAIRNLNNNGRRR